MWYDSFSLKNSIFNYKFKNTSLNNPLKQSSNNKFFTKTKLINFIIPNNWNTLILYNNYLGVYQIFIYSKTYYTKTIIFEKNPLLHYDFNTKQLLLTTSFLNNYKYLYYNLLTTLHLNILKPVFTKLKFKGKGYYIYKNYRNTITPQFGYSHRLYLYSFYTNVKFLNKTTLICFGLNLYNVKKTSSIIFSWRPVNIFTGRGVRFSKQIIYKKSGKISSYR